MTPHLSFSLFISAIRSRRRAFSACNAAHRSQGSWETTRCSMLRLHVKIENPIVKDWLASLSGEKQAPIVFSTEPYERTVQPVAPSFAANTKKTKSGRVSAARPPVESLALTIPVKTPKKRESLTPKSPELPESAVPPPGMQAVTQVGSFRIDGNRIPSLASYVGEMRDSSSIYRSGRHDALLQRLETDGYLYLKGVIPAAVSARTVVSGVLSSLGWASVDNIASKGQAGATVEALSGMIISGARLSAGAQSKDHKALWRDVGTGAELTDAYAGKDIQGIFDALAGAASVSNGLRYTATPLTNFTWIRAKAPGEVTPEHIDWYHLHDASDLYATGTSRSAETDSSSDDTDDEASEECDRCGSTCPTSEFILCDECDTSYHMKCLRPRLDKAPKGDWYCDECNPRPIIVTCWTPLGDVPLAHGGLYVLPGSQLYGDLDQRVPMTQCPKSLRARGKHNVWLTANYEAGDCVIFDVRTIHATGINHSKGFRLSVDTRWAIYPNRKNFGSTLSSKCILRQGVPDDDLSPPLEYNSSEDEGTGGKKGKGKGKGPLLLMDKAAAASGKVVKAVSHKKGKPATSSQPVKSSSGTGYKSTTAPAAVPKPASSVSKLGSKAAPSKPSSKPPSPTPAPTTSVPKRESIFPRTSDAVPKPTAASAPVPAPASARSASKRKQDVISLLSSDDSEEEDSVEVFEVPPKKTPGKSPHSSPQKPSSRRSTSRK